MLRNRVLWLYVLWACAGSASAAGLSSREIDAIPQHVVAPEEVERIRVGLPPEDEAGPARLAITIVLPLGLEAGAWTLDGDTAIWRTRIYSPDARLLMATFDRFELPQGAQLRVSDVAGTVVQGPYTAAHRADDGSLWTALVPGEQMLLELRVPVADRALVDLHLASVSHGIRSMDADAVVPKSGSCNIDVICQAGDGWRDQIRSSVLITIPGSVVNTIVLCSGQIVNNSAQDGRQFLLTANHCGITSGNDQGVIAYFNYQTSSCGGTPNGSMSQSITGSTLRANHSRSDHTLVEMTSAIPASYNVYYSGFNATDAAPTANGRSIHHANGDSGRIDEKRISVHSTAPTRVSNQRVGSFNVDAFRVVWSQGITEGGSSGGGLWNNNRQLIGVLSGGNTSCSNTSGTDFFGRLDVAWASDARFEQFLDPRGTGGIVPGKNASAPPTSGDGGSPDSGGQGGGGGGGAFGGALLLLCVGLGRLLYRAAAKR